MITQGPADSDRCHVAQRRFEVRLVVSLIGAALQRRQHRLPSQRAASSGREPSIELEELPAERQSRFLPFAAGAAGDTALLLAM